MSKTRQMQMQALELRSAGATYQEIADTVGYSSHQAAQKAVRRALQNQAYDAANHVVLLDLHRLDDFQKRLSIAIRNGELGWIGTAMRVMEFRYRLAGVSSETAKQLAEQFGIEVQPTDQPQKHEHTFVLQKTETNEREFITRMMEAANIDPSAPEAQAYLERLEKASASPSPKKKKKKRVVRKKPQQEVPAVVEQVQELPRGELHEEDMGEVVEGEIVED